MTTLLVRTKDNKIYAAKLPMHFMVADKYNIRPENIKAVGFITRNREVWEDRKVH